MESNDKKECPRNCRSCNLPQQAYCAAQMSLSTMDMVKALSDKIDALMGQMSGLLDTQSLVEPKAQEGAAVQKIDSPVKTKTKDNEL